MPVSDNTETNDWKFLHQLSVQLLNSEDTVRKLERVLEAVGYFHHSGKVVISLLDPAHNQMKVHTSIGMSESDIEDLSEIKVGEGCCGMAVAERRRVIVEDFQSDEAFRQFKTWTSEHGIRSAYSTPMFDHAGHVLGVITVYFENLHTVTEREVELTDICASTVTSILERDAVERQLRLERDRRDEILQGMAEGLCIVDRDFRVLEMNAMAVRINKRPLHEMLGKTHWELWPETTDSEVGREYRRAMRDRIRVCLENKWTDPQGNTNWYELTAQPINDGLALYFRDITATKGSEQELRDSATRYQILSETVSDLVWRADANGKPIHDTAPWRRYTDNWHDDLKWIDSVHPEDCARVRAAWKSYLAEGNPASEVYRVRRHDGEYRYLQSRAVPLKNSEGVVQEWIGTCTDITDEVMRTETMRLANERKDRFLAVLGHELRNPLAATNMAAKFFEVPELSGARISHLSQVIQRQVGHMSRLVEDLIDVSRVSEGLVALKKESVDINDIAQDAVEQIRPMMVARRHELHIDLPDGTCMISGDRIRLVQVITNLLSNAARYTPSDGTVWLRTSVAGDNVVVEVTDTGIGIAPDAIGDLFNFYAQAERSTDRKGGGLGIGLALVKSLVELHGGTVEAFSDGDNLGSTFRFTLPRGTA